MVVLRGTRRKRELDGVQMITKIQLPISYGGERLAALACVTRAIKKKRKKKRVPLIASIIYRL